MVDVYIHINMYVVYSIFHSIFSFVSIFHTYVKHTGLQEDNNMTTPSNSGCNFTKNGFEFTVVIIILSIICLIIIWTNIKD